MPWLLSARHIKYDTIYQKMQKLNYITTVLLSALCYCFPHKYQAYARLGEVTIIVIMKNNSNEDQTVRELFYMAQMATNLSKIN